jgi:hypothetical protein
VTPESRGRIWGTKAGTGTSDCSRCDHLHARVHELEEEVEQLRHRLHWLHRRLEWARQVCLWWLRQARTVLSTPGGVPRGIWAFCRGVEQVATSLLFILVEGE